MLLEFKQKKQNNFDVLLSPHLDYLYRLAYRFCCHREDAEDLVQELLIKIYPKRNKLAKIEQLKAWLSKTMFHLFIDRVRQDPKYVNDSLDLESARHESPEPGPDLSVQSLLNQQIIERAYVKLSFEHRIVLSMHDMEGYTLTELENILEIPLGTLKSRLHRARSKMRRYLGNLN